MLVVVNSSDGDGDAGGDRNSDDSDGDGGAGGDGNSGDGDVGGDGTYSF